MSSYPEVNAAWSACDFGAAIEPMANLARTLTDELDQERENNEKLREYAEALTEAARDVCERLTVVLHPHEEEALDRLKAVLAKNPSANPNPSGQHLAAEASLRLSGEASGPVGLGPEPQCVYRDGCKVGMGCQIAGHCCAPAVEEKLLGPQAVSGRHSTSEDFPEECMADVMLGSSWFSCDLPKGHPSHHSESLTINGRKAVIHWERETPGRVLDESMFCGPTSNYCMNCTAMGGPMPCRKGGTPKEDSAK